jgi:hypothetical protein
MRRQSQEPGAIKQWLFLLEVIDLTEEVFHNNATVSFCTKGDSSI